MADIIAGLFQWLGGYPPSALRGERVESSHPINLTGGLVAMATTTTAAMWGAVGYTTFGNSAVAGAIGVAMGASFALSIDRVGAYALDAQSPGLARTASMLAMRSVMSVLVSFVTLPQLVPMMDGGDSERVAIEQREQRDARRVSALQDRFNIDGLRTAAALAEDKVRTGQAAVDTIPPAILKAEADARACLQTLTNRNALLVRRGVSELRRGRQLAPLVARCGGLTDTARRELASYKNSATKALADAVTGRIEARKKLSEAEAWVTTARQEAYDKDRKIITRYSSFVTDSLLSLSPTARAKWLIAAVFLLLVEAAPLTMKALSGQSAPGARISVDDRLERARYARRHDDAVHADEQRLLVRDRLDNALDSAFKSPDVALRLVTLFEDRLEPMLGFDLARRTLSELEEFHNTCLDASRRCPDLSDRIRALQDALLDDILRWWRSRAPPDVRPMSKAA